MCSLRLLLSESYNPWINLSIEECIFKNMPSEQSILFLWRNKNTVVIGRAQNAWKECNTRRMNRDNIRLARRSSGGGAVFHDLGNTCFTFISSKKNYNTKVSTDIILSALNDLDFPVFVFGRNDIVINTKNGVRKVSGSAYRESFGKKIHHGTLLLNVDLNKLVYYLNPDPKKLESKGITSIKSRVINLNEIKFDITHEEICQNLAQAFFKHYNTTAKPEFLSQNNIDCIPGFPEQFKKQSDWNWNFGSTPSFKHHLDIRFDWGGVSLHFDVEQGIIARTCIFTDSLEPDPLEHLAQKLIGIPYKIQDIQSCCNKLMQHWAQYRKRLLEVSNWLTQSII